MIAAVHLANRRRRQVGVDLGRGNVGVAEHGLDGAEVGPPLEQMAGEGVPERVRRYGAPDSRAPGGFLDDSPEPLAGEDRKGGGEGKRGEVRGGRWSKKENT